jgi:hypothetical protein
MFRAAAALAVVAWAITTASASTRKYRPPGLYLQGKVLSQKRPLAGVAVTLYSTVARGRPLVLAASQTRRDGSFAFRYSRPRPFGVLYLIAGRGAAVRLATVLGTTPAPGRVVINERTTVATGFALAQFVHGNAITGRVPGPQNAARMARNLVDLRSGHVGFVLAGKPNGGWTPTRNTFNSLANTISHCVRSTVRCRSLFRLARPPRGPTPRGTLEAVADIARNPWHSVRGLFALSLVRPRPYSPALQPGQRPDAWTLALRFEGDGHSVDGPGNIAIDARGDVWVTNNYVYGRNPLQPVCGSKELLEFLPDGRFAPGSPWPGGGLNGAGFGITLDPSGHVWVGNFGFAAPQCTAQPPHNSVSEFSPSGEPLSGEDGFTQGGISWPQGTVSDLQGNIWVANCGNDTVTVYPDGEPGAAKSLPAGIEKPFDIAFNLAGQAFVTGNDSDSVAMLNPDGTPARSPITGGGLSQPLGIAADTHGNMWVSNPGVLDVPCPNGGIPTTPTPGSVTLIRSNGELGSDTPFTGGGLTLPWGVAVDGDDNAWVANFAPSGSPSCAARDRRTVPREERPATRSRRRAGTASPGSPATPASRSTRRGTSGSATTGRSARCRRTRAATRWSPSSAWPRRSGRR